MVFDLIKSEREYLMRDAIQYKKYKNLESILNDLSTLLDFQYCDEAFLEEIDCRALDFQWSSDKSGVLKDFKQSIQEDFWDCIKLDEINLKSFNMSKEYLFQNKLLHRDPWEKNDALAEVVRNNIVVCINTYLDEWFNQKIESLKI